MAEAELARSFGCDLDALREIRDGHLDFPDDFFDIVVHNQVFEHVENLALAINEIHRVLKPHWLMIGIFPTRGAVREPHLSLSCVRWFSRGSLRDRWAKVTSSLGFGFDFWSEGDAWFEPAFTFLDNRVFFRSRKQIAIMLSLLFETKWIEPEWLVFRVPKAHWMLSTPSDVSVRALFQGLPRG